MVPVQRIGMGSRGVKGARRCPPALPLLLILLLTVEMAVHWTIARNYDIVFERIVGPEFNASFMAADSLIYIRRKDKGSLPGLFHVMNFNKPLPNNTVVEVVMYEMQNNKLVPSWLKYTRNFCDYITTEKRPVFSALSKIYNFKDCPVMGLHKVEDWRPDDKLLPPIMPAGSDKMMFGLKLTAGASLIHKYGVLFLIDRSKEARGGGRRQRQSG